MRRWPEPPALAARAAPITPTSSRRRARLSSGSSTWVVPQPAQMARRGRRRSEPRSSSQLTAAGVAPRPQVLPAAGARQAPGDKVGLDHGRLGPYHEHRCLRHRLEGPSCSPPREKAERTTGSRRPPDCDGFAGAIERLPLRSRRRPVLDLRPTTRRCDGLPPPVDLPPRPLGALLPGTRVRGRLHRPRPCRTHLRGGGAARSRPQVSPSMPGGSGGSLLVASATPHRGIPARSAHGCTSGSIEPSASPKSSPKG